MLAAESGEDLAVWLADPVAATPGGQSMEELRARIALWLTQIADCNDAVIAVTHAAMLAQTLHIPVAATLNTGVAPLSQTVLSFNRGWRLQVLGG